MRHCTLICCLIVVAVAFIGTAQAVDLQWSGGVTLTESTDQSGVFSRIDAFRGGDLLGGWFSTSGVLPVVFDQLDLEVFGDFPGIRNVQQVSLSPDHGKTVWKAKLIPGKGYHVLIPGGTLMVGANSLEWGVTSKDKHNKLILVIIPIHWSSKRTSAAANHIMVQSAPSGWQEMPAQMAYAYLRGFVSCWATPDLQVLGQQQALAAMNAAQPTQPIMQPQTPPSPPPPAVIPLVEPTPAAAPSQCERKLVTVRIILLGYHGNGDLQLRLEKTPKPGDTLVFTHNGSTIVVAKICPSRRGRPIEAQVMKQYGQIQPGDKTNIDTEEK